jgi:hypothetical protein
MSEQLSENIKPGPKPGLKLTRTTQGYLVRSGSKTYEVTVEDDAISCNCSDFEQKQKENTTYHCKHISAVLADFEAQQSCASATTSEHTNGSSSKANGSAKVSAIFPGRQAPIPSKQSHMLIKRSLSGDGRIDSISVEIDFGFTEEDEAGIKTQALKALKLQDTIIKEFIGVDDTKEDLPEPPQIVMPNSSIPQETLDCIMTKVGVAQSKWGTSFYITFELPEGKTAKLFGSQKYLSNQIAVAGFHFPPEKIVEGIVLNIPCRATTVLNGKFINIDRVFPI